MTATSLPASFEGWGWAARELRTRWRAIVIYQLLVGALGVLMFSPLVTATLQRILRSSGAVAVNNFDLVGFFLSPVGLLYLGAAIVLGLAVFYVQQAGLTLLTAESGGTSDARTTLRRVLARVHDLVPLGLTHLGVLLLALLPFAAVIAAVALPLLKLHDINYYLHEQPPEWRRALLVAGVAGALYAVTALWIFARSSLALQVLLLEGRRAWPATAASWRMTAGRGWRIVRVLGGWWLALFLLDVLLVSAATLLLEPLADAAGTRVGLVLLAATAAISFGLLMGFLWVLAGHAGHAALANRFYRMLGGRPSLAQAPLASVPDVPLTLGRVAGAALLVWVVVTAIVIQRLTQIDFDERVAITAHRGSSLVAPENSMSAVRQAIADGADVAEIDVQRTADGAVVLLHDGDLMRMAGVGRKLNTLTLADLDTIDIGRKKDPKFAGERVPTLASVLDTAKAHGLALNIELKYNWPDSLLVPAVIALVRERGYVDGVVLTSLDYASLQAAEALAPEFRTGMIVTKAVGRVTSLPVDFLSMNQAQVDRALLARAHAAGKEVHVWTVNTRADMERMMERGVDNIITDHPAEAAAVRAERATLTVPEKAAMRLRRLVAG